MAMSSRRIFSLAFFGMLLISTLSTIGAVPVESAENGDGDQEMTKRQEPPKRKETYRQFLQMLNDLNGVNTGDTLNKRQQGEKKNTKSKLAAQIHCYFSPVSCGVGRG